MTQDEGPRVIGQQSVANRRSAFASVSPHHPPVAAAPSASSGHIPDKLYFRIGEVARICNVQTYVLRFWETEFPQLRPNKGGTGQRLFRRRDVEMALRIRHLLYNEGYTIPGARQLLKSEIRPRNAQLALAEDAATQQLRADRLRTLYHGVCDLYSLLCDTPGTSKRGRAPGQPRAHGTAPHAQSHDQTHARRSSTSRRNPLPATRSLFEAFDPELAGTLEAAATSPSAVRVDNAP